MKNYKSALLGVMILGIGLIGSTTHLYADDDELDIPGATVVTNDEENVAADLGLQLEKLIGPEATKGLLGYYASAEDMQDLKEVRDIIQKISELQKSEGSISSFQQKYKELIQSYKDKRSPMFSYTKAINDKECWIISWMLCFLPMVITMVIPMVIDDRNCECP